MVDHGSDAYERRRRRVLIDQIQRNDALLQDLDREMTRHTEKAAAYMHVIWHTLVPTLLWALFCLVLQLWFSDSIVVGIFTVTTLSVMMSVTVYRCVCLVFKT